ncbi:hypothetical protein GCM10020220_038430 [Nonomuraea rubra]|uniref:hypothetical protein n=1 Tax=Nonomuraea rubra TaxID=46180 RepID=UPI0031E5A037
MLGWAPVSWWASGVPHPSVAGRVSWTASDRIWSTLSETLERDGDSGIARPDFLRG